MIPSNYSNNKRIAKNTILLYVRMLLTMVVSLFTSRVVLDKLGVDDYGIYNVVGGVVMMFAFLNNSMSTSTQRFMTIELGRQNFSQLKKVFATSLNIHIIIALVIVVLAETIGLWLVNHELVIPADRLFAANIVFQFSILTFCVNIIQVPYNAAIIAHEDMSIYAYISILEVILKLFIAYFLIVSPIDRLIFYAIMIFVAQLLIRMTYQIYCRRKYEECHFSIVKDGPLYLEMAQFAGWNVFGSMAWLLRDQGINILLNMFFGPVVNAARGITTQVSGAVMGFISNFQVALNPQITKNYAIGKFDEMEDLAYLGIKFSFILLALLAFPLCLNINYILDLWLVEVPNYTSFFIILLMIDSLVGNLFGTPLMTSLSATGNIKRYQIWVSSVILCIVPVSYIILKLGNDAPSVYYVTICLTAISGIVRFYFCKKQIGYSFKKISKEVIIPIIIMTVVSLPIPICLKKYVLVSDSIYNVVLSCLSTIIITLSSAWCIALNKSERKKLISIFKSKLNRRVNM